MVTANTEALLPGATVLFDTDNVWARQPLRGKRGVIVHRYEATLGGRVDLAVCVGPCARTTHSTDCSAVVLSPDELLLVPAEATS